MTAIPEAIMAEARKLIARTDGCICSDCEDAVAKALLAAEQRGAERERERAAQTAESNDAFPYEGEHIAAAIRNTKD